MGIAGSRDHMLKSHADPAKGRAALDRSACFADPLGGEAVAGARHAVTSVSRLQSERFADEHAGSYAPYAGPAIVAASHRVMSAGKYLKLKMIAVALSRGIPSATRDCPAASRAADARGASSPQCRARCRTRPGRGGAHSRGTSSARPLGPVARSTDRAAPRS
jgi:hypothetical protein